MIELIPELLSPVLETKLRRWLSLPEAETLRRVVAAQCQFRQSEALSNAMKAQSSEDQHDLVSRAELKQASCYAVFIEILDKLTSQSPDDHFHIAKLKPTTTNNATNDTSNESGLED